MEDLLKPHPFEHFELLPDLYISGLSSDTTDKSQRKTYNMGNDITDNVENLKNSTTFVDPEFKTGSTRLTIVPEIQNRRDNPIEHRAHASLEAGSPQDGDQNHNIDSSLIDEWLGPKALKLIAEMPDVVHGTISPGGDPATLIILKFKFQSLAIGRRFKSARITVTFLDTKEDLAPAVEKITPDGTWALKQSVETEDRTTSGGLTGISGPGFTVNAGMQYQYHETGQRTDQATVSGTACIDDSRKDGKHVRGKNNVVIWNLLENPFTEQGIPTFLQGAILLKRNPNMDQKTFEALVRIEVVVDWKTYFWSIIHKTPEDEPIVFHPWRASEGKNYMANQLGAENLNALQKIIDFSPTGESHKPEKEGKECSKCEPNTAVKELKEPVYETNVIVTGGNVTINGSALAVKESGLLRMQSA
jgi:hypothetical protein